MINVAVEGVSEKDFVFILGYPGRTFRHRTSDYVSYEYGTRMPFLVDILQWQINTMEEISAPQKQVGHNGCHH